MNRTKTVPSRSGTFSRRHFLRGTGVCIAIPALNSIAARAVAKEGQLASTASGAPLRTAFITFPNGAIKDKWWAKGEENDFQLGPTLQPLESLRHRIQVLGGLDQVNAQPRGDGGGDHARGQSVFLTGARLNKSAVEVRAGISIDQAIANEIAPCTRLASLEMTCDATRTSAICDSGYACAYQYNVAWRNATTPMPPENNPRVIFERLFGAGKHGERTADAKARLNQQRSVLDFVMEDTRQLHQRLDSYDRDKLSQYFDGLRDVELRIQRAETFGPNIDPDRETPSSISPNHAEYIDLMLDMLCLAFQTDSTRVATMMLAHDGDNRSFSEIGIFDGHHDLSHHKHVPDRVQKVAQIERWYIERFAKFLTKMDSIVDTDGKSLLFNSQILYGSGNADGNIHTHVDLPLVLAGNSGGSLNPGRYVDHKSQPLNNLYLTLADQLGVQNLPRFGDSTGRLVNV